MAVAEHIKPQETEGLHQKDLLPKQKSKGAKEARLTAVNYIRVSTKEQAERGGEAEGFSIPAQRDACRRKAESIGAVVIEEFVDAGESAKSADRPQLKKMLNYIDQHRPTYVIVHKVDRLARNRADDVMINLSIQAAGCQLVSVSENIDATPSGTLLHGIMSSIAEFYSRNLAAEVLKGTMQKVSTGGTPFKAPLGYLNASEVVNGRENRTIALDPERADHVRWLFDMYATGEWSLKRLAKEATARGMTTRPTPNRPAGPISHKQVNAVLVNRYYIGYVSYRGVEYTGTHEPLVSPQTFQKCQEVMAVRHTSAERPSKHRHYLTGTVKCARCGAGLVYNVVRGSKGQRYDYFTCATRLSERACDLPYFPVEEVEGVVDLLWQAEQVGDDVANRVRRLLMADLEAVSKEHRSEVKSLDQRIGQVRAERVKWAENATSGVVPPDIARDKQTELAAQLAALEARRAEIGDDLQARRVSLDHAMDLLKRCGTTYRRSEVLVRRQMNQAWFRRIAIDDEDGRTTIEQVERTEPFASLRRLSIAEASPAGAVALAADDASAGLAEQAEPDMCGVVPGRQPSVRTPDLRGTEGQPLTQHLRRSGNEKRSGLIRSVFAHVTCSNLGCLVGDTGIEPVTSSVSGKRAPAAPIARAGTAVEVETGVEPVLTALQAAALPLGHSTVSVPETAA